MSLDDDFEELRRRVRWFELRPHHPDGWSITVRQPQALFEVDALVIADSPSAAVRAALERYPAPKSPAPAKKAAAATKGLVRRRTP